MKRKKESWSTFAFQPPGIEFNREWKIHEDLRADDTNDNTKNHLLGPKDETRGEE